MLSLYNNVVIFAHYLTHNTEVIQMTTILNNTTVAFSRVWEMPNSNTFDIRCIGRLIHKYLRPEMQSIDPFANKCRLAKVTNDLNPEYNTDYHMDAVDFLKMFADNSQDFVFYDPPYSLRQVSECYKNVGIPVTTETTQSSWRSKHIDEIARILKPGGIVMCFGWNSSGVGIKRGFQLVEVLLVAHGGMHHDTICTVERKQPSLFQ